MFLLGNSLSTNRDYYSTLLGIIIVTDWQVFKMDAQNRIKKLMEEKAGRITAWQKRQTSPIPQSQICSIEIMRQRFLLWNRSVGHLA
mgnify:CR=1 FL=1